MIAELERMENVGENQNGDCSVFIHAFVSRQSEDDGSVYAHAFVGRSNPFQAEAFSVIWSADKACTNILLDLARTQKNTKQQYTFVIIFNSYYQLYNLQYSKVGKMALGIYLRYLVKDQILNSPPHNSPVLR